MGGCTRISIDLRLAIRCSEVGKTRSRDLRLVNGKAGGLTLMRQSGMLIRLRCAVREDLTRCAQ